MSIRRLGQGLVNRDAAALRVFLNAVALPGSVDISGVLGTTLPGTILPDAAGTAGTALFASRSDHLHPIVAAAPGSASAGTAASAEGTANSFARSDHVHNIDAALFGGTLALGTTLPGTILPDAAGTAGTATTAARSDHLHPIVAAAPGTTSVNLSASAEGTANSFARSDHAHNLSQAITPTWTGQHTFDNASGVIINQGAGDGAILDLRSSDVAHGMTDGGITTDAFGVFQKADSDAGGLIVRGYTETTTGARLDGFGSAANTTKDSTGAAPVQIAAYKKSGTASTTWGAGENILAIRNTTSSLLILDASSDIFVPAGGRVFLGDSANTGQTVGITINQGANDNEALALKSSDVTHGVTAYHETDTYGVLQKAEADYGGLNVRGVTEDDLGILVDSFYTNAGTVRSTSGLGAITLRGYKISGTTVGAMGTGENILAVRNASTTNLILDSDGNLWVKGWIVGGGSAAPPDAPISHPADMDGTADSTYSGNEVSMINGMRDKINAVIDYCDDILTYVNAFGFRGTA